MLTYLTGTLVLPWLPAGSLVRTDRIDAGQVFPYTKDPLGLPGVAVPDSDCLVMPEDMSHPSNVSVCKSGESFRLTATDVLSYETSSSHVHEMAPKLLKYHRLEPS
jgi:hypothetical protein